MLGLSTDSMTSHEKFVQKYNLTYPLLSDPDATVCTVYGVYKEKKMYGRAYMGIERTTFLIDAKGDIARVYPKVKVDGHAAKVLSDLKQLI